METKQISVRNTEGGRALKTEMLTQEHILPYSCEFLKVFFDLLIC